MDEPKALNLLNKMHSVSVKFEIRMTLPFANFYFAIGSKSFISEIFCGRYPLYLKVEKYPHYQDPCTHNKNFLKKDFKNKLLIDHRALRKN